MDVDSIMLSATHETEKDKNCMILLICGTKSNKKQAKTNSDTGNRMVVTRGESEGGGQRR